MLNTVIWYHSYVLERNISSGTVDISEINALYFILNKMLSVSEIFVFVLNVSVQKMSTNIYPPRVLHFHFSKMRIVMQLPWGHPTAGRAEIHQDIQNIICTALVRLINFFLHDIFWCVFYVPSSAHFWSWILPSYWTQPFRDQPAWMLWWFVTKVNINLLGCNWLFI